MDLFRRNIKLKVENLDNDSSFRTIEIAKLQVEFEVSRTLDKEPSTLSAEVYNLAESTRSALENPKTLIATLSAGYADELHDLFLGDVRNVRHRREGANIITTVEAGDGERGSKKWARQWFKKDTSLQTVFEYLVDKAGIGKGNLSNALNTSEENGMATTLKTGLHVRGYAVDELLELSRSRGIGFSVQNNEAQFLAPTASLEGIAVERLTPESGLIGTPTIDNEGIMSAKSRLRPNIFPGSAVDVESEFVSGRFKVLRADYRGAIYGPDFSISVEGKELRQ